MPITETDAAPFLEFDLEDDALQLAEAAREFYRLAENKPTLTAGGAVNFNVQESNDFRFTRALFLKLKNLPNKGPQGPIPGDADL